MTNRQTIENLQGQLTNKIIELGAQMWRLESTRKTLTAQLALVNDMLEQEEQSTIPPFMADGKIVNPEEFDTDSENDE